MLTRTTGSGCPAASDTFPRTTPDCAPSGVAMTNSSMTARRAVKDDMRRWGERGDEPRHRVASGDGGVAGEVLQYTRDPVNANFATLLSAFYRSDVRHVVLPADVAHAIIARRRLRSRAR